MVVTCLQQAKFFTETFDTVYPQNVLSRLSLFFHISLISLIYLKTSTQGFWGFGVFKCEFLRVRKIGLIIGLALLIQLSLGIANVLGGLPIFVAVGHNGGAGLLLLTLVALIYFTSPRDAYGL